MYSREEISVALQGAMNALNPVKKVGQQVLEAVMTHGRIDKQKAQREFGSISIWLV